MKDDFLNYVNLTFVFTIGFAFALSNLIGAYSLEFFSLSHVCIVLFFFVFLLFLWRLGPGNKMWFAVKVYKCGYVLYIFKANCGFLFVWFQSDVLGFS